MGVLCGRERAEVLLHLQWCERCQDCVRGLAVTATRWVELVPEVDPPADFEQRVLAAIAATLASTAKGTSVAPVAAGRIARLPALMTNRSNGSEPPGASAGPATAEQLVDGQN